jgi:hypothetical protein
VNLGIVFCGCHAGSGGSPHIINSNRRNNAIIIGANHAIRATRNAIIVGFTFVALPRGGDRFTRSTKYPHGSKPVALITTPIEPRELIGDHDATRQITAHRPARVRARNPLSITRRRNTNARIRDDAV